MTASQAIQGIAHRTVCDSRGVVLTAWGRRPTCRSYGYGVFPHGTPPEYVM